MLVANRVIEKRGAASRIGIRLGTDTKKITLGDNRIEGVSREVVDLRKKPEAK